MTIARIRAGVAALALSLAGCGTNVDPSQFSIQRGGAGPGLPQAGQGAAIRMVGGAYEGEMRHGVPEGAGTFNFDDGRRYDGQFKAGRMHGDGRMRYPDGRLVAGRFEADAERDTTITWRDGRRFVGGVANGLPQGSGTMHYPDGGWTTARFTAGRAEGRGYQSRADGSIYYGPFKGGEPAGSGVCAGGGRSKSSSCERKGDRDVTEEALAAAAAARVKRDMEAADKAALDKLEQEHERRRARHEEELAKLRDQRQRQGGPTRDGDFNCYCAIASLCLTVTDVNDRTPADMRRLQQEKRVLECRRTYADWLGIKDSPDFARRIAALNEQIGAVRGRMDAEAAALAQKQRDLAAQAARIRADQARQKQLREEAMARDLREREARLAKERQQCRDPKIMRARPCGCSAILNIPLKSTPGSACEA